MQFRNIIISQKVLLRIKDRQLWLCGDEDISFPLEDINCVLIENPSVSISAKMIAEFAECQIVLYVCDHKHLPSAVLLPLVKHSRHFQVLNNQISMPKPLRKRLWQKIIVQKITNQAICLQMLSFEGAEGLFQMAKQVKSGDSGNVEAKAAAFYFKCLFGKTFSRDIECKVNASLNYGYSIIRGFIARTLVCYGYEPSIGLWHESIQNSFNLADDLIEPFRPLIDYYVALTNIDLGIDVELDKDSRYGLINLINYDMDTNGEHRIVKNCIDIMVSSLTTSMNENINKLITPELIDLREHRYE